MRVATSIEPGFTFGLRPFGSLKLHTSAATFAGLYAGLR